MNAGSAVPSMTIEILNDIEISYPGDSNIKAFDELIQPFFDIIKMNNQTNTKLAMIRDYILPKLMSGEIDVSTLDIPN